MAHNLMYSVANLKNQKLNAITTALGNGALMRMYDGAQPASPDTAISTQVLLATLTGGTPFAAGAASGVLTAGTITSGTAGASGTVAWGRLLTSGGTALIDFTVGVGSGFDFNINSTTITSGDTVACSALTITGAN